MTREEMIDTLRDVCRNVGDLDRARIEKVIAALEAACPGCPAPEGFKPENVIATKRDHGAGVA